MKKRIYQLLAQSGLVSSKKQAEALLKNIMVNDKPIKTLNYFVDPKKDKITLNNVLIKAKKEKLYILFNKPRGIETTKENLINFLNLETEIKQTIFPVGRLDKDSEGLLILTSDGLLTEKLMEPDNHVEKTYIILAEKEITDEQLKQLEEGIEIQMEEDHKFYKYTTLPCKITKIENKTYEVKITEGKKRQIRRMLEAIENKVITLKRIKIGKITLDLKPGEYKTVTKEFILSNL